MTGQPFEPPVIIAGQAHYFAARSLEERMSIRDWTRIYATEADPAITVPIGYDLVAAILPTVPYAVITDRMTETERARLILAYANGPGEVVL